MTDCSISSQGIPGRKIIIFSAAWMVQETALPVLALKMVCFFSFQEIPGKKK
jgi:hypothetical protein